MKKLLTTAVAGLIFVGTANAQGQWYTDYNTWLTQMTSIGGTATYDSLTPGLQASGTYSEAGVSLTNNSLSTNLWSIAGGYISSEDSSDKLTFTFAGNAFGGHFLATDPNDNPIDVSLSFSTSDGSSYNLTNIADSSPFTFLGYISDNSSALTLDFLGTPNFSAVDSFTFGNGTNPVNPGSAVPEPGEYVSMAILGIGLCGMIVRSRRNKKS